MELTPNTHVVLWHPSNHHFHIETVNQMLENNTMAFLQQTPADYLILAFSNSLEAAHGIVAKRTIELRKLDRQKIEAEYDKKVAAAAHRFKTAQAWRKFNQANR